MMTFLGRNPLPYSRFVLLFCDSHSSTSLEIGMDFNWRLQGKHSDFQCEPTSLNKPPQGSMFEVFKGVHCATGTRIVAKVIPGTDEADRHALAIEEINVNVQTRQYSFMPIARYLSAFEHGSSIYLIFALVEGVAASAEVRLTSTGDGKSMTAQSILSSMTFGVEQHVVDYNLKSCLC